MLIRSIGDILHCPNCIAGTYTWGRCACETWISIDFRERDFRVILFVCFYHRLTCRHHIRTGDRCLCKVRLTTYGMSLLTDLQWHYWLTCCCACARYYYHSGGWPDVRSYAWAGGYIGCESPQGRSIRRERPVCCGVLGRTAVRFRLFFDWSSTNSDASSAGMYYVLCIMYCRVGLTHHVQNSQNPEWWVGVTLTIPPCESYIRHQCNTMQCNTVCIGFSTIWLTMVISNRGLCLWLLLMISLLALSLSFTAFWLHCILHCTALQAVASLVLRSTTMTMLLVYPTLMIS